MVPNVLGIKFLFCSFHKIMNLFSVVLSFCNGKNIKCVAAFSLMYQNLVLCLCMGQKVPKEKCLLSSFHLVTQYQREKLLNLHFGIVSFEPWLVLIVLCNKNHWDMIFYSAKCLKQQNGFQFRQLCKHNTIAIMGTFCFFWQIVSLDHFIKLRNLSLVFGMPLTLDFTTQKEMYMLLYTRSCELLKVTRFLI